MTSIQVRGVVIDIPIFDSTARSARTTAFHSIGGALGKRAGNIFTIRALDGIDLDLGNGDRIGVIGHNGAGKTTLLRLLAGIYEPTAGSVKIHGRIAAMFDVGLGMNYDATGYDNIRLMGLYLGMSLSEIEKKVADIIQFSELGDFLDLPVRTYSQGMLARLSFSLATSVDAEILIIDEGIAAGDAAFMSKASNRLLAMIERSNILVIASHSMDLIKKHCSQCVFMEHGRIVKFGPTDETILAYAGSLPNQSNG